MRKTPAAAQQPLRVLCVLPHLIDPRISLRVEMLREAGFLVEAVAFETRYSSGRPPDCPVESLGRLRFKPFYARAVEVLMRLPKVRAAIRRNDVVYAFHTEMGLAAAAAGAGLARPLVLEVHDIRRRQVARGLQGRLVRLVDRCIARACALLVTTSADYRAYYRDWLRVEPPSLVVENKVSGALAAEVRARDAPHSGGGPGEGAPLRIGYFGLLKDEWSMRVLESLAASAPDRVRIVLAGTFDYIEDLPRRVARHRNMEHRGPYSNPDALEELYTGVDVVLSCYSPAAPYGWARSNRYYEACLFRRPLIVRAGTGDAAEVEQRGTGLVIADDDAEGAAAAIGRITPDDLRRWQANMAGLPLEAYAYTDEAAMLGRAVIAAMGEGAEEDRQRPR